MDVLTNVSRLMSPRKQILTTIRPTPSTISFTVSTRPVPHTLTSHLLFYFSILLRLSLGIAAIALLWAKWRIEFPVGEPTGARVSLAAWIFGSSAGHLVTRGADTVGWRWLAPAVVGVLWAVVRRGYTEESLLVLQGLGVQTSTSSPTYLSTATTRFIPTSSIQDIFIHEAFKGFEVRFYLAIVAEGEDDVVVVFPRLLPKRQILEEVWRGARACLYEPRAKSKQ
ncbi:hypothetical protein K432DRAFT_104648 [Lepidopterella palustris CBS 459.81]|uniref:Phosphatidylinositol N-acetylglucosaminyltransferase subunit H conserved domain-containing protein n=1 Tax=Lepidopterella palustris CBS 459.81 TaxID=1314670 RepID=A0A8E2E5Z7_9PEZI|nr:hypothetical protein K432DRAFT_104648 [Lepidopterella palustris CBS 459.81]